MSRHAATRNDALLETLRVRGPLGVTELSQGLEVTPTAVRQRLTRLMAAGLVERKAVRSGRGRPSHRYRLTQTGVRLVGSNFVDLALALWREIRLIEDGQLRQSLLKRVVQTLASGYSQQIEGETTTERMESLARLLHQRRVPFEVHAEHDLPVLTAHACPYPELAEADRGICVFEKMLISEVLRREVDLAQCRLDGCGPCRFEPKNGKRE